MKLNIALESEVDKHIATLFQGPPGEPGDRGSPGRPGDMVPTPRLPHPRETKQVFYMCLEILVKGSLFKKMELELC